MPISREDYIDQFYANIKPTTYESVDNNNPQSDCEHYNSFGE